jgi:hypothetical protein
MYQKYIEAIIITLNTAIWRRRIIELLIINIYQVDYMNVLDLKLLADGNIESADKVYCVHRDKSFVLIRFLTVFN